MKHMLLTMLILASFCWAQSWEVVKEGDTEYYPNGGDFIDNLTGVYVGGEGVVVKTTDGGQSGETLRMPDSSTVDWNDVEFANPNVGYAIANDWKSGNVDGYIYKTINGGANWTMVGDTVNYPIILEGLSVVSEDLVYIIGEDSLFLKTTNGGDTWVRNEFGFNGEDLDGGVAFLNADTGVVAVDNSKNPMTWYTYDGGQTWNPVLLTFPIGASSFRIYDVSAGGNSTFALSGYHYTVFMSNDAGQTYTHVNGVNPANVYLKLINVVDDNNVFAAGSDGFVIKTVNAGATWDTLYTGSGHTPAFMDFLSTDVGYIFQYYGQWFRTDNGGTTFGPLLDWPNVSFWGLALPTDEKIVLTSYAGGELTMSEDGGVTWDYPDNHVTKVTGSLYECEFGDALTGLAGGEGGDLLKTTDGGSVWSRVENPMFEIGKTINAVRYVNNQTVLAGGSSSNMMKSIDGGDTWEKIQCNASTSTTSYDFWAINENQVIATGSSGRIFLSNTAVDTFSQVKDYGSMAMRAVEFRGDVGIVPASSGHLYRTTVADWDTLIEVFTDPDGDDLYDVEFITDSLVYVVGENGKIYKSTDAGLTWNAENSPTEKTLQKVRFRNNMLWAVGKSGTVINLYIDPMAIPDNGFSGLPQRYSLTQNYPNPFNPSTTIEFSIKKAGKVELTVFNVTGQKVATLVNSEMNAGQAKVAWNAAHLASGVYFYRLTSGNFTAVKKLLLVK